LKRDYQIWIFFIQIFWTHLGIMWLFSCPSHSMSASALPGNKQNQQNIAFFDWLMILVTHSVWFGIDGWVDEWINWSIGWRMMFVEWHRDSSPAVELHSQCTARQNWLRTVKERCGWNDGKNQRRHLKHTAVFYSVLRAFHCLPSRM